MFEDVRDETKRARLEIDMRLFLTGLQTITDDMTVLLADKRASYGSDNLRADGLFGIMVRIQDKISRLRHMYKNGLENTAVNENAIDAWMDICGYSLLACMYVKYGEYGIPDVLPNAMMEVEINSDTISTVTEALLQNMPNVVQKFQASSEQIVNTLRGMNGIPSVMPSDPEAVDFIDNQTGA